MSLPWSFVFVGIVLYRHSAPDGAKTYTLSKSNRENRMPSELSEGIFVCERSRLNVYNCTFILAHVVVSLSAGDTANTVPRPIFIRSLMSSCESAMLKSTASSMRPLKNLGV